MNYIRILITGGSSYLGQHLVPAALRSTVAHTINYTFYRNDPLRLPYGHPLDVRDARAVHSMVTSLQPDVIIHTAGSNRATDMTAVIQGGTQHIVEAAAAVQARLIYLSTDSIFEGNAAPYTETATPSPVNEYGRAKVAAEAIVAAYPNHVIIRTSLIYGLHLMDRSAEWMVKALRRGQPVQLFSNQYRNPVWAETLSQVCLELVTHPYTGILNVAGRQVLSRAEFALRMLDWWQVTEREMLTIGPTTAGEWPLDCRLDLSLAMTLLSTPLWGVDEVLSRAAVEQY